jgi:hypothetical protein
MREGFRHENLTEGATAQQAEEDGSSGEEEDDEKKEETCAKFKFSEMKQTLASIISFVDSNPQHNEY